jgi:hypothetical protein
MGGTKLISLTKEICRRIKDPAEGYPYFANILHNILFLGWDDFLLDTEKLDFTTEVPFPVMFVHQGFILWLSIFFIYSKKTPIFDMNYE